jgi:MoxR-like ATPase
VLTTWNTTPPPVGVVLSPELIESAAEAAEQVHVAPTLLDWIVRLVQATRNHASVRLGASPRASLALLRCAKARAFIHGRDMVLPDDVKELTHHVLNHRILLSPEAELDQVRVEEVIAECMAATPYDREP